MQNHNDNRNHYDEVARYQGFGKKEHIVTLNTSGPFY